jgi:general secretion pathway protein B
MSYILDALRRADSERERGQVPGIHALSMPPAQDEATAAPRAARWVWALAATGTLLAGVLAWVVASPETPMRQPPQAHSPATPAPIRPLVADPAAVRAVPPTVFTPEYASTRPASTTAAASATPGTTLARGAGALATPAAPAAPPTPATPVALGASPITRAAAAPAQTPRTAAAGPAAAPGPGPSVSVGPEPRIQALHELPEEVRRAIPALVVNGSVYSKNPADRFLIVNGQIVHESEPVAPDVVLEKIGQRAAVLNTHGHRFEISY